MKQVKEQSSNGSDHNRYAAIYARVSTEDQADGYSLPSQIDACQKLAAQHGYHVPDAYVFQEDYTGKVLARPLLPHLRELVCTCAVQAVIIYEPDRLARKFALQVILEEEMDQAGVKLIYVKHTRDETPEGRAMGYMRGVFAEVEREKIMERTRRGQLYRAKAGNPSGGAVPLGYRAILQPHKARWEIDESEATLVRRIFSMCLNSMSTYTIALQLSHERQPTRGNGCRRLPPGIWQESTVHKILTNEAYAGQTYWNKYARTSRTTRRPRPRDEWVAIPVPAIIDEATFQAVQRQLVRNRELSRRNRKRAYLLSGGHLRCGRCGRVMSGSVRKAGRRYYRCTSQYNVKAPELRCHGSLRADEVEAQVWAAVVRLLEQPELIAAEVTRQQETADDQRGEIEREGALIETELAKCDRETQRWAQAYAGEVINLAELKAYRADIEKHRQSLLTQQAACQAKLEAIGQAVKQVEVLMDYCARVRQQLQTFDEAEKQRALEALDIRARWMQGQPLTIEGSIPLGKIVPIALRWPRMPS
jgi:site-specific DNA recombinase